MNVDQTRLERMRELRKSIKELREDRKFILREITALRKELDCHVGIRRRARAAAKEATQ